MVYTGCEALSEDFYKYILVFFCVMFHLTHYPKEDMEALNNTYISKKESIEPP